MVLWKVWLRANKYWSLLRESWRKKRLLEDIEDTIELLRTDYDNKELDPIKKQFFYGYMVNYENMEQSQYDTDEKQDMLIRENIEVVIDFYQRFVEAMWKIMDDNPEGNCISVTGP